MIDDILIERHVELVKKRKTGMAFANDLVNWAVQEMKNSSNCMNGVLKLCGTGDK